MSFASCTVVSLIAMLMSFPKSESATTEFIAKPSTPSPAVEGQNFTLEWNYTLDGTVGSAQFNNVSGSGSELIGRVFSPGGSITVQSKYQERFRGEVTNTRAELTILTVQRSDQGTYRIQVLPTGSGSLEDTVDVIVQYPPNITSISLNQTVDEGDVLLLNCTADGNPEPSITWNRLSDNSIVNRTLAISCTGKPYEVGYRCTADNGIGRATFSDVFFTFQCPPKITSISLNQTVVEGDEVLLNCTAVGNPEPNTTLTRLSDNSIVNRTLTITGKQDEGGYRCTADNGIGDAAFSDVFITVHYPPNITFISLNQTVNESDVVPLNCTADGNPEPSIIWTRLSDNSIVSMPLTITGKQDEGGYKCTANNGVGNASFSDVFITVESYSPIHVVFSTNLSKGTVDLNDIFNLTCSADANPAAKYRFYRGQENLVNITDGQSSGTFLTSVSNSVKQETYRCIPFNSFGDGPTKTINVTVYYPPIITSISLNQTVVEGDVVPLNCAPDGNPIPSITWTKLSDNSIVSMPLNIIGKQDEGGYRCTADNGIGDSASSDVFITFKGGNCETNCTGGKGCLALGTKYFCRCPNGTTGENCGQKDTFTNEAKVGFEFTKEEFKPEYKKPEAPITKEFILKVEQAIKIDMNDTGLIKALGITLTLAVHEGKRIVIANVKLTFIGSVGKGAIKELIDEALKDKKLGDLDVGRYRSDGFFSEEPTSDMPTSTGQPVQDGSQWTIIGAVAGSVVLVALVVAFVTCWVHKKRKCRKDTKIHNSECEESLHGDSPNAKVNRAYAESGPPSASGTQGAARQQSQDLGAIPTYAVVDKSKKKKKKEEKPPIYASVDKSKKRKKKTDDKNLYDNVEEPKKERKPGEVLYAELGDFQNPAMPEVSTSPATLPPLRRPPSYEQTQYADITAFLKGDATLPQKEGNEGSEMQEQSANQSQHDVDNKETPM